MTCACAGPLRVVASGALPLTVVIPPRVGALVPLTGPFPFLISGLPDGDIELGAPRPVPVCAGDTVQLQAGGGGPGSVIMIGARTVRAAAELGGLP